MSVDMNNYKLVAEPCRNFCIFSSAIFTDPADGIEKLVLSNYTDGGRGLIVIINTENGEHETLEIPGDEGCWAILNYKNEKLVLGTCSNYGYVHTLDLKTRKWLEPLRDKDERYIWNMTLGSDGKIYGGTWPGCVLLQYDPEKHELVNIGKLTDVPGNMYCRPVDGRVPGYVLVCCGCEVYEVVVWEIATGKKFVLGKPDSSLFDVTDEFIILTHGKELEYYSIKDFSYVKSAPVERKSPFGAWADSCVRYLGKLKNGKIAGLRGQEYFIADDPDTVPEFKRIPGMAPATTIMTIISHEDGMIWGATALGQTIFKYDPATGEYWNSPQICNNGGEVYGMCFIDNKLYMSAYAGGDHVVYNPAEPWDQYNNVNPKTLQTVSPDLIRPYGKSIVGPDGNFWTGWSAKYGVYGGGLSRIDAKTNEMTCWYDPIPQQQIASITCDEKYIYFTTNGEASGRADKVEPFSLCVWDLEGKITWQKVFESGIILGVVLAVDGYLVVTAGNELLVYKTGTMEMLHTIPTEARCSWLHRFDDGSVGAFCGKKLYRIVPSTGESKVISDLPNWVGTSAAGKDGRVYFSSEAKLYQLNEDTI